MQFKVLNPVSDGNGRHEIGDIIELNDKDAAEMLALKTVEPYSLPFGADVKAVVLSEDGKTTYTVKR